MEGWLKLHRAISDHWIYSFKEPDKALAWIDLLIMARHTDGTIMLKGRALFLKRSQIGISQIGMQKRWGWSQNKVKRFLKLLKKHGMADFETNDLTTIITICNFESYQGHERTDERPSERTDERTTNDQSNDDIRKKERNKVKKKTTKAKALDFSAWPQIPSDQILSDYKAMRRAKRAPFSQTVADSIGKSLVELASHNISVDAALTIACERGWQGFKVEWVLDHIRSNGNGQHRQAPNKSQKRQVITESVMDIHNTNW